MDKHFDFMDTLNQDKGPDETDGDKKECCTLKENYLIHQDIIKCNICSNIISNISANPEWRFYGNNDSKGTDPTRCGMPVNTLLPESSVGSSVSLKSYGKTMNQIRKYQQYQGMPYKERSLYKVFVEIQEICTKNNIPLKIINEAKSLYSIISSTKISRGANRKGIIAACVYFACKECGVPRSSKELAGMFSITITVMTKGVKRCQEIISMNKVNKNRLSKTDSINPLHLIERFCNKLSLENKDINLIIKICEKAIKDNIISENTPPSIAAGCIFYFIKLNEINITKKDISDICKISEVTINKCTKKLETNNNSFSKILKEVKHNTN